MTEDNSNSYIDIAIDATSDFKSVVISFVTDTNPKKDISIEFPLADAQQLYLFLGEAITTMLLHELKIDATPEVKH